MCRRIQAWPGPTSHVQVTIESQQKQRSWHSFALLLAKSKWFSREVTCKLHHTTRSTTRTHRRQTQKLLKCSRERKDKTMCFHTSTCKQEPFAKHPGFRQNLTKWNASNNNFHFISPPVVSWIKQHKRIQCEFNCSKAREICHAKWKNLTRLSPLAKCSQRCTKPNCKNSLASDSLRWGGFK